MSAPGTSTMRPMSSTALALWPRSSTSRAPRRRTTRSRPTTPASISPSRWRSRSASRARARCSGASAKRRHPRRKHEPGGSRGGRSDRANGHHDHWITAAGAGAGADEHGAAGVHLLPEPRDDADQRAHRSADRDVANGGQQAIGELRADARYAGHAQADTAAAAAAIAAGAATVPARAGPTADAQAVYRRRSVVPSSLRLSGPSLLVRNEREVRR